MKKFKLDIQYFAENSEESVVEEKPTIDDLLKSFKPEDILNHDSFKSILDSRIGSATNNALEKARKKWEDEKNTQLSEADKLAKMNKQEKEKYEFDKEKEKFQEERLAFEKEKLIVEASKTLSSKGIDTSLANFIVGKDADETKKRVDDFIKAFNSSVESAVDAKMKGHEPIKKATSGKNDKLEEIFNYMKGY